MNRTKHVIAGLLVAATLGGMATPTVAQSRGNEAIAVCESQRRPFFDIRQRNRETIRNRVIQGVAVGLLGGGLLGSAAGQGQSAGTQRTAMIVGAVIGGVAGGMNQYIAAKQQITDDNREIARMIDADAGGYAGRIQALTNSINATSECRQNQIAVWEQRLIATRTEFAAREAGRAAASAAAPDDRARRTIEREGARAARDDRRILDQMTREQTMIQDAMIDDRNLFSDVLKYFDDDLMAMAQAQALVEGTSAASLRGSAEAYSVEVVPPAILAATTASSGAFGSSSSAFGSSASAFGGSVPQPATTAVPIVDLDDPNIYLARIVAPTDAFQTVNGHQQAIVAQRDAAAMASAADQTNRARLQVAVARGERVSIAPPA
ncbi:hypothetical protein [Brevundimonas sp.]|uniref:hypothetical protein n=1 Tax=Brevundimonas sp. TaxID=1871086 RepID=UPI003D0E0297